MDENEELKNTNKSSSEPSPSDHSKTKEAQDVQTHAEEPVDELEAEFSEMDEAEDSEGDAPEASAEHASMSKDERVKTINNGIDEGALSRKPKERKASPIKNGIIGGIIGGGIVALLGAGLLLGSGLLNNETSTGEMTPTNVSDVAVNITTDTTAAVEKVQDAVVSIVNRQQGGGNMFGFDIPQAADSSDGNLQTSSEGSGVIYKTEGDLAYIVTNNHVIDGAVELEILMKDGTKEVATVVGSDVWTDLAVLTIPNTNVTTVATFGNSEQVNVGEPAIAIGSPLGTEFATSVTQGIISAKDRSVSTDIDGDGVVDWDVTALQTDASINPGNSGGALINIAGQVIGINSMKISDSNVEGMGFAIPSNDVITIINELEQNGEIIRPILGVSMLDISQISVAQQESVLNLPEEVTEGVVVADVQSLSAAELGGLEQYDVITEMNDTPVTSIVALRKILYSLDVGSDIAITYYRDGQLETTTVTLTDGQSSIE